MTARLLNYLEIGAAADESRVQEVVEGLTKRLRAEHGTWNARELSVDLRPITDRGELARLHHMMANVFDAAVSANETHDGCEGMYAFLERSIPNGYFVALRAQVAQIKTKACLS